ncbi:predicted protein [Histoplasma capsulatum var. duboisii H88]|uniref:Predicted protein n=1 Tax=Ajellomyces capsulatus (strain H88) TaxID=544711 RepID=F0UBY1_AJEC8|nr:predicted protein [Histoplasma capsulatum var. duboisii H88]
MNMLDHFQLKDNSRLLHPHTDTDPVDEDKSAARHRINTLPCMSLSPYSFIRDDKHWRRPPHKSQQWDKCSQEVYILWNTGETSIESGGYTQAQESIAASDEGANPW